MSEKELKELEAKKKRLLALSYLEKQGQSIEVKVNGKVVNHNALPKKPVDNTFELLLRQSVQSHSQSNPVNQSNSKYIENIAKTNLLVQQQSTISEVLSKPNVNDQIISSSQIWKTIEDSASGKHYYWNTVTNETTWTKPQPSETEPQLNTSESVLPENWICKTHPATKQKYYLNTITGKSSSTFPSSELLDPNKNHLKNEQSVAHNTNKINKSNNSNKRKVQEIDPLDPTGGKGKWSSGLAKDGKMADSTAGGPLWQQRPYPAPGQIMRQQNPNNKRIENSIGPTFK
eukprot:gene9990-13442_t